MDSLVGTEGVLNNDFASLDIAIYRCICLLIVKEIWYVSRL